MYACAFVKSSWENMEGFPLLFFVCIYVLYCFMFNYIHSYSPGHEVVGLNPYVYRLSVAVQGLTQGRGPPCLALVP